MTSRDSETPPATQPTGDGPTLSTTETQPKVKPSEDDRGTREEASPSQTFVSKGPSKEERIAQLQADTERHKAEIARRSALEAERMRTYTALSVARATADANATTERSKSRWAAAGIVLAALCAAVAAAIGASKNGANNTTATATATATPPPVATSSASNTLPTHWACGAATGPKNQLYVIRSATLLAELELEHDQLTMDVRTVYSIQSGATIASTDPAFIEEYTYQFSDRLEPWPGSEQPERLGGNKYRIPLELSPNHEQTITTGARFIAQWPPALARREYVNGTIRLASDEFAVSYPNTDGDTICELNIIASSDTLALTPSNDRGAIQVSHTYATTEQATLVRRLDEHATLAYRWTDVPPGSTSLLKFHINTR